MNPVDDVEQTIGKLHIATKPETDELILDEAFTALETSIKSSSPETYRQARQNILLNRIIKITAAAAIITIIFAVLLKEPASKTNTPANINVALTKAENISIAKFHPGDTEPYEQQWLSAILNVKLIKSVENNRTQFELWDIRNKTKMQTFLSSNTVRTEPITESMLAEFKESMIQQAGFLRYFREDEIPKDTVWEHVVDSGITTLHPGKKIYEVTWQQGTTDREILYKKWRIFADAKTSLPARAEMYTKSQPDKQYELESYTLFTYPKEENIKTVIRAVFGRAARQPEYIGTPEY
jgi:hypothetical protein